MSAKRSWRFVLAAVAAGVVMAGGVGMTVMQLRAGDTNEPGPPNIDTLTWVTERGDQGWIIRRPKDWPSMTFNDHIRNRLDVAGVVITSHRYSFRPREENSVPFDDLPATLAALHLVHTSGGPAPFTQAPNTSFPLALEEAERDPRTDRSGLMLRRPLVLNGKSGWSVNVWIGNAVGRQDVEIARRIVSSFGFPAFSSADGLTLEEQMIAHEIAESYRGARSALKGRTHTHPEWAADQTGSAKCGDHKCGLVVFQITGGLRFRVLVDITDRRAIAFS